MVLGIFWGTLIFNLDRFLVSTVKKNRTNKREFLQVLPRLLLAVFLGIVIAQPLELKIFEQEIEEQLHHIGAEKLFALESSYYKRRNQLSNRILHLQESTSEKFDLKEQYYQQMMCECDGTCGTGKIGRGSECERKENRYLRSEAEYLTKKNENDIEIKELKEEKEALAGELRKEKTILKSSFADGLLTRLSILSQLELAPRLAIVLLLISIEIAPILVKLLSPYGPYDHLLKTIEYNYEIDELTSINTRNQELNHKLTLIASMEQNKVDQEIANNEGTMRLIGEAHLELVQEQLKLWVEKEKVKILEDMNTDKS